MSLELLQAGFFTLLFASEVPIQNGSLVVDVAMRFVDAGCCYMYAIGADSGRIHDCFDEAYCFRETNDYTRPLADDGNVLMTCGTDGEAADEGIEFFLGNTQPTEKYAKECNRGLVVVVGGQSFAARIESLIAAAVL